MAVERIPVKNNGNLLRVCGGFRLAPNVWQDVPISFLESFGADPDLQFDFAVLGDSLRSRTDDGKPYFDFYAPLSAIDGYGRHALDIWRGLERIGAVPVLRAASFVDPTFLSPSVTLTAKNNRSKQPAKVGVAMTLPYDPALHDNSSLVKIAITQFETNRFPEYHVKQVNLCDHLIVTSSWQPGMMRRSGVTIPIDTMTPGVDTDFWAYRERPQDGLFKILIVGALTGRKNPIGAIEIFEDASMNDPNWRLTLKTRNADGIDTVKRIAAMDKRISLIVEDTPPQWLRDKYFYTHDVFLWPSKGEGCGLPPLEAMSTGMEVVCSFNTGMMDFIHTRHSWPIRSSGMEPANKPGEGFSGDYETSYGSVGDWWVPDKHHAIHQLRKCFEDWKGGRGKGRLAAEYVREYHTLDKMAASVLKVVEPYL